MFVSSYGLESFDVSSVGTLDVKTVVFTSILVNPKQGIK